MLAIVHGVHTVLHSSSVEADVVQLPLNTASPVLYFGIQLYVRYLYTLQKRKPLVQYPPVSFDI
jgi:hypothetical protein